MTLQIATVGIGLAGHGRAGDAAHGENVESWVEEEMESERTGADRLWGTLLCTTEAASARRRWQSSPDGRLLSDA
jgi:hypothetical protein